MKPRIVMVGLLLALGTFLFAGAQTETEAAAEEMRPVWVWGVPAWAGDYDPATLEDANKFAMEKFGVTFKITSGIPQDMTGDQALQLALAQGEFPDLIRGVSFELLAALANEGRLLPMDKYFEDRENFPVYAEADMQQLLKFRVEGTLYGIPGFGWRVRKDDPAMVTPMWNMRRDVYEKYGYPQTSAELLDMMRKIKASGEFLNLDGNPVIPFTTQGGHSLATLRISMWQFKGAGFQVDPQKRLIPEWASKQAYDAIKYFNTMWREGMMSPGLFIQNNEKFQASLKNLDYAFNVGHSWNVAVGGMGEVLPLAEKYGRYAEETQRVAKSLMIMLVNPIRDNPGMLFNGGYGGPPSPTVVSADCPNPDGAVGYLHWLMTDEGLVSSYFGAGQRGVHWDFVDPDDHSKWEMLPPYDTGLHKQDTALEGGQPGHSWESSENAKDPAKTPQIPPNVHYLANPAYSSFFGSLGYYKDTYNHEVQYKDLWPVPEKVGDPTVSQVGYHYSAACLDVVQPLPSYGLVTFPAPPAEVTAMATALERFDSGIAQLIMSDTEEAFEKNYQDLIKKLIGVANWKPIWEAKQQRWLDWMKSNNVDDRDELKTVDPIPEWKDVMGW